MPADRSRDADAIARTECVLCDVAADRTHLFTKGGWNFVRCVECGLVSLSPIPSGAELIAHHEASYRTGAYAVFAAAEEIRAAIARHRLAELEPLAPSGAWLDVGCSTGAFVAEVDRRGLTAEGVELSAEAVRQATARGLTVHHASVEGFDPPHPYAVVTAFDVVEHLPDPRSFLDRVRGWLTSDSLLALTLPDCASPLARIMGRHWFYYTAPDHVHYFTPATIRRLLASLGYREITVRPVRKPLTLDYAVSQLGHFMPTVAPLGRGGLTLLPTRWRRRPIPLPLGEMMVTARPPH